MKTSRAWRVAALVGAVILLGVALVGLWAVLGRGAPPELTTVPVAPLDEVRKPGAPIETAPEVAVVEPPVGAELPVAASETSSVALPAVPASQQRVSPSAKPLAPPRSAPRDVNETLPRPAPEPMAARDDTVAHTNTPVVEPEPPAPAEPSPRVPVDLTGASSWTGTVGGRPTWWMLEVAPDGQVRGTVRTRFGADSVRVLVRGRIVRQDGQVEIELHDVVRPDGERLEGAIGGDVSEGTLWVRGRRRATFSVRRS